MHLYRKPSLIIITQKLITEPTKNTSLNQSFKVKFHFKKKKTLNDENSLIFTFLIISIIKPIPHDIFSPPAAIMTLTGNRFALGSAIPRILLGLIIKNGQNEIILLADKKNSHDFNTRLTTNGG